NAAIASAQMDKLDSFLRARKKNAAYLIDRVKSLEGVEFTQRADDRTHVFYLFTLYIRKNRDRILKALNDAGIGASVYFKLPVHKTPLYVRLGYGKKNLRHTEAASGHVLSLPVHPELTASDLQRVSDRFAETVRTLL
ncbi:MAG TPA: DegT/DnrJ/EryC1/StrS family aminotransferase, partial [Nitrososphaerales archaeon]|nr:DegT/DnrJ/EryC1/StrS family aminotransferase [Nitrososphaerales archaeon]